MAPYRIVIIIFALLTAASCRQGGIADLDEQEKSDPAIQAAWAAAEAGDLAGAETQYEAIIRKQTDNARAHLDLANVLMAADEKPIKSIYHFMRYQELRPGSEKEELIRRNIRQLTSMLGSKVTKSKISQLEHQMTLLQAENDKLRHGMTFTPATPVVLPPQPVPPVPVVTRGPVVPQGPRLYTVRPGESLSRIAQLMYGDGELSEKIYEANRGKLKSRNSLQAGQVLVIPP